MVRDLLGRCSRERSQTFVFPAFDHSSWVLPPCHEINKFGGDRLVATNDTAGCHLNIVSEQMPDGADLPGMYPLSRGPSAEHFVGRYMRVRISTEVTPAGRRLVLVEVPAGVLAAIGDRRAGLVALAGLESRSDAVARLLRRALVRSIMPPLCPDDDR
jgi:hypothetical protein